MNLLTRIAVTGLGAITPFGEGAAALWRGLLGGETAIRPVGRFDVSAYRSRTAGLVPAFNPGKVIPAGVLRRLDPTSRLAVPAAAEALADSHLQGGNGLGIILGTNSAGGAPLAEFLSTIARDGAAAAPPILFPYTVVNAPASQCGLNLALRGPNLTVVQNEGSSAAAIATAARMLACGGAEALLAGGADDVTPYVFEAYDRVGVLSRDRTGKGGLAEGSRPFDRARDGFVMGEAACFLTLETQERARARGARVIAWIEGFAEGRARALPHALPSDPAPLVRVILSALRAARIGPGEVGAVLASANSTRALDALEAETLRLAFEGKPPPIASVRGAIGESGVGGALSAAAACFAMAEARLPGTAGLETADPDLGLDASSEARQLRPGKILVTAFSRGGGAVVLVLGPA